MADFGLASPVIVVEAPARLDSNIALLNQLKELLGLILYRRGLHRRPLYRLCTQVQPAKVKALHHANHQHTQRKPPDGCPIQVLGRK